MHDVLLCINTGKTRDNPRPSSPGDQFYVRGPEEMYRLFPEHAEAVRRSQEIADGCDIQLDFKKRHFPVYVPPEGKTPEEYLRSCANRVFWSATAATRRGSTQAVGARTGHHLPDGLCELLPDRLGLRASPARRDPGAARGSACGAIVSYVPR
jgi:DNA polymerase-3 subunit alpha